ncbi:hypothetical protein OLO84_02445 [Campylobacter jejuni]|nr:hypothetical protein [Campylobacter jejuni]
MGVNFRRVFETEGGNWTCKEDGSFEQSVFACCTSISCNYYSNPSCLKACPNRCNNENKMGNSSNR